MSAPSVIAEAYRHCEQIVRTQDKDHFLAALFAPVERRPYLFALHAFAVEIGRVKDVVREPMTGMIRLQWWLEALSGLRDEESAASPVMIALRDASRQTGVVLDPLTGAVEARQKEFQGGPAFGAASAIFVMASCMLGGDGDAIEVAAEHAAKALLLADSDPRQARNNYNAFYGELARLPERALPAFLTAALVPLRLKNPQAPQWRRQILLLRAAWFGFPKI
jgi:phytoene/squalene synthetase